MLLGTFAYLDGWPALQTMASRPIVVGPLAGLVLGAPGEGVFWGAVFEAVYLTLLPIGAARYPDAGLAALAGTAVAITGADGDVVPAGWATAAAVIAGALGDVAGRLQRRWNAGTAARVRREVAAGDASAVGRGIAIGLAGGAAIGGLASAVGLAIGFAGLEALGGTAWTARLSIPDVRMAGAAAIVASGARLFGFRGRSGWAWAGGAVLAGLVVWAAGGLGDP